MNIGDWLAPVASVLAALLVYIGARQKYKSDLRELDRQHNLKLHEIKQHHEADIYNKIQEYNDDLWQQIRQLKQDQLEKEKATREREDTLNSRVDILYRRVGNFRDYANRLRAQLISANMVPDPWPEES